MVFRFELHSRGSFDDFRRADAALSEIFRVAPEAQNEDIFPKMCAPNFTERTRNSAAAFLASSLDVPPFLPLFLRSSRTGVNTREIQVLIPCSRKTCLVIV